MADKNDLALAYSKSPRTPGHNTQDKVPADNKVAELRSTHPAYAARKGEWVFFGDSYYGGRRYLEGGYLFKHPNEGDKEYNHRLKVACYYNFCQEIVDLYVSYLFQKPAEIDYGALGKDEMFESFRADADLKGNRLSGFMRESQRMAGAYSHVALVVDKPKADPDAQTRQDEKEKNLRPYIYRVLPTNLLDWKYERVGNEGYRLTYVKILEDNNPERYRLWYTDRWEVWEIKDDAAEKLEEGGNPLGKIPVVILVNLAGDDDLVGRSDLNDIAYVNRHIYNLCSWNDENIENTCFAMLARAKREKGKGGEESDAVGPSVIIEYDPTEPNDKPYWLEPPGVHQEVFDKRLDRDIQEIHRMAKHGSMAGTPSETSKSPKSGLALELEFRHMNSTLAEKADNIEEAHVKVCELFVDWQEGTGAFDGTIDYPDDFNVEDLALDLENAINATALRISGTFNREVKKRLVRVALPKADAETTKEINDQIDAQADLFLPAEFGLLLQYNLTNPIDLLMKLKGIESEAEAAKLLERNKELNQKYGMTGPAPPNLGEIIGDDTETEEED